MPESSVEQGPLVTVGMASSSPVLPDIKGLLPILEADRVGIDERVVGQLGAVDGHEPNDFVTSGVMVLSEHILSCGRPESITHGSSDASYV